MGEVCHGEEKIVSVKELLESAEDGYVIIDVEKEYAAIKSQGEK